MSKRRGITLAELLIGLRVQVYTPYLASVLTDPVSLER